MHMMGWNGVILGIYFYRLILWHIEALYFGSVCNVLYLTI